VGKGERTRTNTPALVHVPNLAVEVEVTDAPAGAATAAAATGLKQEISISEDAIEEKKKKENSRDDGGGTSSLDSRDGSSSGESEFPVEETNRNQNCDLLSRTRKVTYSIPVFQAVAVVWEREKQDTKISRAIKVKERIQSRYSQHLWW